MYQKYKDKTPKSAPSPNRYAFLSHMRYTQLSVCSNEEHKSSIYTLSVTWIWTEQVSPTKLTGLTSPRKTQNNIILYSLGYYWPDLQWRLYLITLWWKNRIVTSRQRNKTSPLWYISKIHLEYSSKLQYFNIRQGTSNREEICVLWICLKYVVEINVKSL